MNVSDIPEKLEYTAKIDQGAGGLRLTVGMIPFVKENGQIKKVTSFQIVRQAGAPHGTNDGGTLDPSTLSVLKTGSWYKIKIAKSGVFKIDKTFLNKIRFRPILIREH